MFEHRVQYAKLLTEDRIRSLPHERRLDREPGPTRRLSEPGPEWRHPWSVADFVGLVRKIAAQGASGGTQPRAPGT
jgi:hypothetical protein